LTYFDNQLIYIIKTGDSGWSYAKLLNGKRGLISEDHYVKISRDEEKEMLEQLNENNNIEMKEFESKETDLLNKSEHKKSQKNSF